MGQRQAVINRFIILASVYIKHADKQDALPVQKRCRLQHFSLTKVFQFVQWLPFKAFSSNSYSITIILTPSTFTIDVVRNGFFIDYVNKRLKQYAVLDIGLTR